MVNKLITAVRHPFMPWLVLASIVTVCHLIFKAYLLGHDGIGYDYSGVLPALLDNHRWYVHNGWSAPPWFTAGFCGGQPTFPAHGSMYYSLPQLLTVVTDPLTAVYITVLVFAAIGTVGAYLLLRQAFCCAVWPALLGATLFGLNGFFAARMLIGHFEFHAIMLVPWLAMALLWSPSTPRHGEVPGAILLGVLGGCVCAYWVQSGMLVMIVPALLSVVGVMALYALTGLSWRGFALRSGVAIGVAVGLSVAKLTAVIAFAMHVPRTLYPLPGFDSLLHALAVAGAALFLSPVGIEQFANHYLLNNKAVLHQHEYEYGLTVVPLLVFALSIVLLGRRKVSLPSWRSINGTAWAGMVVMVIVLLIPLAVNVYTPAWNALLKQIPVINSASNLVRWFFVYIPLVTVAVSVALDRAPLTATLRSTIAIAGLVGVLLIQFMTDRGFYTRQTYNPETVVNAYRKEQAEKRVTPISHVGVYTDSRGKVLLSMDRNDAVTQGVSQLACYNPVFGYRLENFPTKFLHPGPILDVRRGRLNLKNPACYVFPDENGCEPGDHFPVSQRSDAERLAHYLPYPFARSTLQKAADMVTLASTIILPLLVSLVLIWLWRSAAEQRRDGPHG